MTERRDYPASGRATDDRPHVADDLAAGQGTDSGSLAVPAEDVVQLAGIRADTDQAAVVATDEVDRLGEMTDTGVYQGDLEARAADDDQPDHRDEENLELLLEDELRAGETHDAGEAAEEGLTWVPPVDPPVMPADGGQVEVAAGFGSTADDEPFDADHHRSFELANDERTERVREALLAHAGTAGLVDGLRFDTIGSQVVVEGTVEDLDDEDQVVGVIEGVDGVSGVVSRIRVSAAE